MPPVNPVPHFQDRRAAIAAFEALWEKPRPYIIVYDGFSGLGKTTLIQYLEYHYCILPQIPYSTLDFADSPSYSAILRSLLTHHAFRPHLAPTALQVYFAQEREILGDLRRVRDDIKINASQSGGEGNTLNINLSLAEMMREREKKARESLANAWLECLITFTGEKLVFFFDTFERFESLAPADEVSWFWRILEEAAQAFPALRIVVGTREAVQRDSHALTREALIVLDHNDSDFLLVARGVTDEAFRGAVYERLAKGHPGVTEFAAKAWLTAREAQSSLTANDVEQTLALEDAVTWVQQKIIGQLEAIEKHNQASPPFSVAAQWAPLLRDFNLDTLNGVLPLADN